MSKQFTDILSGISPLEIQGPQAGYPTMLELDSRNIEAGGLFAALKGYTTDGHNFIKQAVNNGAKYVLCEAIPDNSDQSVTFIKVQNSTESLGILASHFYGNPSEKIKLVGVTGTNGKTTTVTLLYKLFKALGYKAGLLSTIKNMMDNIEIEATHTTSDAITINKLLAQMVDMGVEFCFMEASSHAIDQNRIHGLKFLGGVFTNLTHDHLDYHETFDAYLKAKKKFFDTLPADAFALVNADDKNGRVMLQNSNANKKYYSLKRLSDFKAKILESYLDGMLLNINGNETWVRLIGEFNAYNVLAVFGTAILLQQDKIEVLASLSALETVAGRFQYVRSKENKTAIIDYAHTPDALENVLKGIHHIRIENQQIITVVGTGGNRDKAKRPVMAKIASKYSNKVILTSDNPRDEDPQTILEDMMEGVKEESNILTIENRKEAIKTACMLANKEDIILIAGKGHETYQEIKGVKHPFDDREIVKEIFERS